MKKLLYRVWHKVDKKMYYDVMVSCGKEKLAYRVDNENQCWVEMDYNDIVIMNGCSGLCDDVIYEGDIVDECGELYLVYWKVNRMDLYGYYNPCNDIPNQAFPESEVIVKGNMYENPELIKDIINVEDLVAAKIVTNTMNKFIGFKEAIQ